jgi:hypothetical protein
MFKRIQHELLVVVALGLLAGANILPVLAQEGEYTLNVHKVFGYSSGSQLRGTMAMEVIGPEENVKSVTFMVDNKAISTDSEAPFSLNFKTTDYPTGWHELSASLQMKDSRTIITPVRRYEFATSQQEADTVQRVLFPILGLVLSITIIGLSAQFFFLRNKPVRSLPLGTPRAYGIYGGAICPHCQRPFPLHLWSINLGFQSKYDRCEFCGKWAVMKRASHDQLAQAEAAEMEKTQSNDTVRQVSEEEKLKAMIRDSRYTDEL